ncbi:TetR/AcrR family transcriptional regulator [Paraferrimonas sp. SM1919]|uniref:TetR/AcrR family transcriptional regulator n=1 Tax=Paraferrimonas sp. SM1919 TaxID=2662263 RepID=UPI0013D5E150|nr:TetR/AcrR family transcriptional regulator [Paraferrimonas sp. SM1919]
MKTRDKIILKSLALFNELGERNVTTNHIASALEMSPGNLYYHFSNKQEIILAIFEGYQNSLQQHFLTPSTKNYEIGALRSDFQLMFHAVWDYRFLYFNLTELLSQYDELKVAYQSLQNELVERAIKMVKDLVRQEKLRLNETEAFELADTSRMLVAFWLNYKLSQANTSEPQQAWVYQGVEKVIKLFQLHAVGDAKAEFKQLAQHFNHLAMD